MKFSQVSETIKNLPAVQQTQVWLLGQEDPLEKGMKTHSSILAWRIPWTEDPGGLQSMGVAKGQIWLSDYPNTHKLLKGESFGEQVKVFKSSAVLWLSSDWLVMRQCSRNLVLSLKSPSSTWMGTLVPAEELNGILLCIFHEDEPGPCNVISFPFSFFPFGHISWPAGF